MAESPRVEVVRERPGRPRFGVTGTAVVCCVHGVAKHQVVELVYDMRREQASECPCCVNAFATDRGDPIILCHDCRPRSAP